MRRHDTHCSNFSGASKEPPIQRPIRRQGRLQDDGKDNLSARWIQSDSGMTSTPVLLVSFPTAPITPVKSVAIGQITSVRSGPRKLQLDLKYIF
jgi:hypothetical protein